MSVKLADVVFADDQWGKTAGYTSAGTRVVSVSGGAFQDDNDEDEPESDDKGGTEDDDDDDGEEDKDWTPPTRDEWAKLQRTAQKRKEEREAARKELADARKGSKSKPGKDDDRDEPDEETVKAVTEKATKERDSFWKPIVVKQAAVAAMVEAGYTGSMERLPRYISRDFDLEEIDVDDDGELDGLEEQIALFKKDNPDLFVKRGTRLPTADKDTTKTTKTGLSSTSEKLMQSAGLVSRRR